MRKLIAGTCLLTTMAVVGHSQSFEVASVKINQSQGGEGNRQPPAVEPSPGNLTMRNVGMMQALIWAYKISPLQISNPQLIGSDRYDILAKANGPAKTDEMRVMLQALLAERFKLTLHRETKEMSAYALVEAKGGHKLKESEDADGPGVTPVTTKMALSAKRASLDLLTMFLSQPLRTPCIDMTGLKGKYDFELDVSAYVPMDKEKREGDPPPDPVYVLQQVLPKQLGLKLEARKLPVEMLVIDHIEKKPIEN